MRYPVLSIRILRSFAIFCAIGIVLCSLRTFDVAASSCGCHFIRGDANHDGLVNLADSIYINGYLFSGYEVCNLDSADANDDGLVDLADGIYLNEYLFGGGSPPPSPFPEEGCDPTCDYLENCCSPSPLGSGYTVQEAAAQALSCPSYAPWDYTQAKAKSSNPYEIEFWSHNEPSCSHPVCCSRAKVRWTISDNSPGVNSDAFASGTPPSGACLQITANFTLAAYFATSWACSGPEECCNYLYLFILVEDEPSVTSQYFKFEKDGAVELEEIDFTDDDPPERKYKRIMTYRGPAIQVLYEKPFGTATAKLIDVQFQGECWKLTEMQVVFLHVFSRAVTPDLAEKEWIYPEPNVHFSIRLDSIEKEWTCE